MRSMCGVHVVCHKLPLQRFPYHIFRAPSSMVMMRLKLSASCNSVSSMVLRNAGRLVRLWRVFLFRRLMARGNVFLSDRGDDRKVFSRLSVPTFA